MRARVLFATMAALALTATALATPSVTMTLQSSKNGLTVAPGAAIDWTVKAADSTGDNYGLALIACDMIQDASNPAKFDLPPGNFTSIVYPMTNFSRAAGISNPGEGGASTGYIGVQRSPTGQTYKNLIQIGGGQNTFGAAGTTMGTNFNWITGVGQGAQPQVVLSGSFLAPSTAGTYVFRLTNGIANTLDHNNPPNFTTVTAATVNVTGASFTFTVTTAPPICRGDGNCDGVVSWRDIDYFVAAMSGQTAWEAMFPETPSCDYLSNDVNEDGSVTWRDIDPFVAQMGHVCP